MNPPDIHAFLPCDRVSVEEEKRVQIRISRDSLCRAGAPVVLGLVIALASTACGSRSDLSAPDPEPSTSTSPGSTSSGSTSSGSTSPGSTSTTASTTDGTPCAVPDEDGDGHAAFACGGDDCDDHDASIHPGAPDNAGGQWTTTTVDAGPGTFVSSALALDAAGQPRLAYVDKNTTKLRVAERVGDSWKNDVVAIAWGGPTRSTSLTFDSAGATHVAYAASGVRRATFADGAWDTEIIDDAVGTNYFATSIVATEGSLHIAYRQLSSILYAHFDGTAWAITNFAPNGSASGADVSIGIDGSDAVHISFESVAQGMFGETRLRYATNTGNGFQIEDVDVLPPGKGNTYGALAVTAGGTVHIAYRDGSLQALRLATGTSGSFIRETVDGADDAGGHASIALDAAGAVHIAYRAAIPGELRHATNASGAWVIQTVDSGEDTGLFTSVKIDAQGQLHIGYIDASQKAVRYATTAPVADGIDQDCDGQDG